MLTPTELDHALTLLLNNQPNQTLLGWILLSKHPDQLADFAWELTVVAALLRHGPLQEDMLDFLAQYGVEEQVQAWWEGLALLVTMGLQEEDPDQPAYYPRLLERYLAFKPQLDALLERCPRLVASYKSTARRIHARTEQQHPIVIDFFEKVSAFSPDDRVVQGYLVLLYHQHAPQKAETLYLALLEQEPTSHYLILQLAKLYQTPLHQPQKALPWFERWAALQPPTPTTHHALGELWLCEVGDYHRAATQYTQLWTAQPDYLFYAFRLARAQAQLLDWAACRQTLEKVVQAWPERQDVQPTVNACLHHLKLEEVDLTALLELLEGLE